MESKLSKLAKKNKEQYKLVKPSARAELLGSKQQLLQEYNNFVRSNFKKPVKKMDGLFELYKKKDSLKSIRRDLKLDSLRYSHAKRVAYGKESKKIHLFSDAKYDANAHATIENTRYRNFKKLITSPDVDSILRNSHDLKTDYLKLKSVKDPLKAAKYLDSDLNRRASLLKLTTINQMGKYKNDPDKVERLKTNLFDLKQTKKDVQESVYGKLYSTNRGAGQLDKPQ